jgi:hypothetical protein
VNASADDFQSLRNLWIAFCFIERSKGINVPHLCQQWTESKRKSLKEPSYQQDFEDLCAAGCRPFCLVLALAVIEVSKATATTRRKLFGSARHRQQIARALSKGADALEEVHERFIDINIERFTKLKLDDDLRKSLSADPDLASGGQPTFDWPKSLPAHPATAIRSFRAFAELFGMFDKIAGDTHAHSPDSFSKYLISAYVKRVTAKFHDREVSALINSALGKDGYDETTHRVWRSRNYLQLEKEFSSVVTLLLGIGVVTSQGE